MKRKSPFRKAKRKLKKSYTIQIKKRKNGDLYITIPDDIVDAFGIEVGDIVVWEVIDERTFLVRFAKKGLCSTVEEVKHHEARRSLKRTKKREK